MMPSASLPPRPRHTFSLRTVEKLYQRQLESTGAHVRPEQIPTIVENVRRSLLRVEEVLNYRLQCPASTFHEEKERPLLSNFERVRVGQILANAVLDLAIISMVGGNEAADAVTSTRKAPSLSSSHVAAPSLHPYGTEELSDECKRQKLESNLYVGAVEETMELPEVNLLLPVGTGGGSDAGSEASLSVPGRTIVSSKNCRRISKNVSPLAERLPHMPQRVQRNNTITSVDSHGNCSNCKPARASLLSQDMVPYQNPLSHVESPLSPVSVHFKPVLSMHSGADSSSTYPLPRQLPRRYYDIDLQKVSDFTRCLRTVQRLNFTDSDFEKIGLRYAIPGIRELHPKEVQFLLERVDESCNPHGNPFLCSGEDEFFVKRTISMASTGGGTDADVCSVCLTHRETNPKLLHTPSAVTADPQLPDHGTLKKTRVSCCQSFTQQKGPGERDTPTNDTGDSSPQSASIKEQCLPLFRGGKETIVQKKDLQIFLAMVEARLKSVDQEINGRLHFSGTDLASSSGEDDTAYTA
ncbi:hypothetical protein BCY84_15080 [Trypanosoma cruzi cruzi]|nr:hypothetical protein BCY84_15080 [Trypanosoma cruzi cruzi]